MKRSLITLLSLFSLRADIVYESGDLIEFFGGTAPESAYNNWVSHVTEGIATDGYNDYGPEWLDVQTNGFGHYKKLSEFSQTLVYWETILSQFVNGDTTLVDSLLHDSLDSFFYELVIFDDTTLNKTFHLLREQIDTSFVDENQIGILEDDVIGSFRNSWGLYIINPNASRKQVLIQVPHPCDDFIAPYIAMDLFLEIDAFGFMINGSGREVDWSEEGTYTNSKSHSDPSRYEYTIFQKFQEAVTEPLINTQPHWPLVFAVHSFDNASHLTRHSVIVAAGASNTFTNKPIRDITDDHFDIINFTEEFPIIENQFNNSDPVHVSEYYEAYYDDIFNYDNGSDEFTIRKSTSLNGIRNGHQMIHLQNLVNGYSVYEPWVQIEMDEKPMLFDNMEMNDDIFYSQGFYPTNVHNFSMIRDYYLPFIQAVDNYLIHWETISDISAPDSITYLMAYNMDDPEKVYLTWSPEFDTNFKSNEIQFDIESLSFDSPIIDFNDYSSLQNMTLNNQTIIGVNNSEPWFFRIRAKDHFENAGPWSVTVSNILPGHSPPDTILNFNESTIIESIIDEDIDGNGYSIDTINGLPGNSPSLTLFGNTWKSVPINSFLPDSTTILQVYARVDSLSEIQAIGFSDGERTLKYSIAGREMLDIDEWIPVYQGSGQTQIWNSYKIPIGNDWVAWFDSLSAINEIQFINDNDDTSRAFGRIHFSIILDISPDLPISPTVYIDYSLGEIRLENNQEMVSLSFTSTVIDPDSYNFAFYWEFGDGSSSNEIHPSHEYVIQDDHNYTVILTVEDETGQRGWGTTMIQVDPGESSFPLTLNFVGDIMMGRRFENDDGIISNLGINALFEPTYEILGLAADVTVANLEILLSDQGSPHPTKSIVFRCAPANVGGLIYAGIDVVSLANNHIMDYMEPAMIQTQNLLNEAGIHHSGAGMNSYEAYLPAMISRKGQTIAFLSVSDRTGQYNNYQPYLNAGENKPGFAYMTPYYLKQQIQSVQNISDLVVVEMHSGSEYSYSPGGDYDSYEPPNGYESMRLNPASEIGFLENSIMGMEVEDYSPRLDRPQMWDRAMRQFAIDEGADAVIVHHPHIIQGLEIYNGKMIAHSLGNFIFDLNYPETYPSMILNSEADESGFTGYSITPIYIDDYLTVPAFGELANYILDHIAMQSRELNTYVHVNPESNRGIVIMDTLALSSQELDYSIWNPIWKETEIDGESYFVSNPLSIPNAGSLSKITGGFQPITHYRLGREKIWMKNFENEGSSLWNFNSNSEFLQDSIFRRGETAASQIRYDYSQDNIITNLEDKMPFKNEFDHTIHGYIKTENGKNVTLQIQLSESRSGESILTSSMDDSIQGTKFWLPYWGDVPSHDEANFFDIRMRTGIPDTGKSQTWFDDVGLVEWDSLKSFEGFPISVIHPNDFNYIQVYATQTPTAMAGIQMTNTIIGDLPYLDAIPKATNPVITAPGKVHFYDESKGAVGNWHWVFLDQINVYQQHPTFHFFDPGIYEVSLTITGLNGETDTNYITIVALSGDTEEYNLGDVNGDGILTEMDVLLCINYIIGLVELEPEEFLAADVDGNGIINIYDALLIADLFS